MIVFFNVKLIMVNIVLGCFISVLIVFVFLWFLEFILENCFDLFIVWCSYKMFSVLIVLIIKGIC